MNKEWAGKTYDGVLRNYLLCLMSLLITLHQAGLPNKDLGVLEVEKYKTAFDRDMFKLIECNAARQKWIDQSISFNLYNNSTSLKHLNDIYMACWEAGLKTTYYLRNRAATKVEKSTSEDQSTCSLEAMKNGETCESCQ